ncbi:hypothetical protein LLG96_19295 [bacterium]|nr:hypothetical protein [bacterium]
MASTNWNVVRRRGLGRKLKCILAVCAVGVFLSTTLAFGAFFDTAGQSARPMGMGEVFLASTGDANSFWYNPAGLAHNPGRMVGLSYGVINPSIASDLMTYNLNVVFGGFGVGISGLGADGASEMVINGAYGKSFGEKFALGGNVRMLRWAVEGQDDLYHGGKDDDLSKVSFSLDLNATYGIGELFGIGQFSTGVYVKNAIMPNISESGDDGGKLPIEAGIGLMVQKDIYTVEGDVAVCDGNTFFRLGTESGITGSDLKLRAGFIYGSDFEDDTEQTDIDLGLGYNFKSVIFDYAYNLPLAFKETGGRHFISFGISF